MKKGFTLAEILITLGIVGVVAALTMPALIQDTAGAKTGPTLAKVRNTFEVANESLFRDNKLSRLSSSGFYKIGDTSDYMTALSDYMKISKFDKSNLSNYKMKTFKGDDAENLLTDLSFRNMSDYNNIWITNDGILHMTNFTDENITQRPHKQIVGRDIVDINGTAEPNSFGKDLFLFNITDDGSLSPNGSIGGLNYNEATWNDGNDQCNASKVDSGLTCAGAIFDNDLKVIY